jgi:hypothetical protein
MSYDGTVVILPMPNGQFSIQSTLTGGVPTRADSMTRYACHSDDCSMPRFGIHPDAEKWFKEHEAKGFTFKKQ